MKKFFKSLKLKLNIYHYRLRNTPLRQMVRSANYCLEDYNVNPIILNSFLFIEVILLIVFSMAIN